MKLSLGILSFFNKMAGIVKLEGIVSHE